MPRGTVDLSAGEITLVDKENKKPTLRVAARVLRQLGAELITSDEIALNELVKNAFDAQSPRVKIEITAPADPRALRRIREQLSHQRISVEDALSAIFGAFPSNMGTIKRAQVLTPFKRAATDRSALEKQIGEFLENEFKVSVVDTGEGMTEAQLINAFLVIGTPNKWVAKKKASDADRMILGEKGIGRLSMMRLGRYAAIKSAPKTDPRWHVVEFDWHDFDDPDLYLEEIEIDVGVGEAKNKADSGTSIEITGLASDWDEEKLRGFINDYVRRLHDPLDDKERPYPIDVVFNGARQPIPGLPEWLRDRAKCSGVFQFRPKAPKGTAALSSSIKWSGNASADTRNWSSDELATRMEVSELDLASVGPVDIRFIWFNRAALAGDPDRSIRQIRDELNVWSGGFAIYRDGFRVGQTGGMEDDWLEMDKVSLKSSGYTLNRYQTVGSLAITSARNNALVDAANREGLVNCPEFETLVALMTKVVLPEVRSQIATVQEIERKAATDESVEESLKRSTSDVKKAVSTLSRVMRVIPEKERKELGEVRAALEKHEQTIDILGDALKQNQETRIEVLELAGIGMVVEIVVHELARLTENAEFLLAKLSKENEGTETANIAQALREQFKATNKRIRTVDELSPSGRNRKVEFDIVEFINTIAAGYKGRFKQHQIGHEVLLNEKPARSGLVVKMVKGLVGQVIENLISNSVYWLQRVQPATSDRRVITIEVDPKAKAIVYSDTGPGIAPEQRSRIFRPYFSMKPKGKGLGLFIASEIAAYHGGKLYLDDAPDKDGRLRTFVLELPKD